MRFPLVIPPLLLLILNWSSLDSDAVAFHNGSFVAVQSLDHIQFANISSIDGNFATRNTRYRNSSTHDVKPLTLIDSPEDIVPFHFIPDPQESRGKRQKRDSQEDELAQAKKNVTDLTNEIGNITEKLKKKEEEASTENEKYQTAKASVDTLEKPVAAWKDAEKARLEWESANEELTNSNTELDEATKNLKAANETLDAAEKEFERVEGEPAQLDEAIAKFEKIDPTCSALQTEVNKLKKELPKLQKAVTNAKNKLSAYEVEVTRAGCKGKDGESRCSAKLQVLSDRIDAKNEAQVAYDAALIDNKEKSEKFALCEPEWTKLKGEMAKLRVNLAEPRHGTNLLKAESDVQTAKETQAPLLEDFYNAVKAQNKAAEKEQLAQQSYDDKASKVPVDGDELSKAYNAAKDVLENANDLMNAVDKEVNQLKNRLKEKNIELAQANAKVEALKQSEAKGDERTTDAAMYIGIGAGCGIILIILVIGGILFAVKQRKSKVKEEPSPTINPDALKYEKVPALEKSRQETATRSNSNQRVTSAKSNTNVAANQPNSAPEATPTPKAAPPQSNANVKPAAPLQPAEAEVRATPLVKNEKITDMEIEYIDPHPLVNEVAKPKSSSSKPGGGDLPHGKQKWAKTKAIAMRGGDEVMEPMPDDQMLHSNQNEEQMELECEDTQYERSTTGKLTKLSGAALLDEHPEDKLTVAMATPLAAMILIAVSRVMNIPYGTLKQTMVAVREILKTEKMLVTCGAPAVIFGDVHGQVGDLTRLLTLVAWDAANPSRKLDLNGERFVFCGDYVDRGNRQVEVLELLFCLKIMYPNNVFLVRGNHETRDINMRHGFRDELISRYGEDEGKKLYEMYNEVFAHLPIACVIGGQILCVHGGISPLLTKLEDINNIPKPLYNIADSQLAQDILWADPMIGLTGTKPNNVRGISNYFGEDTLDAALKQLGLSMVVCGHRIPRNGVAAFANKLKLVTVFTATNAGSASRKNSGAALRVFKDFTIQALIIHKYYSAAIHGVTHKENNEKDDDYAVHKEDELPELNMFDTIYPVPR